MVTFSLAVQFCVLRTGRSCLDGRCWEPPINSHMSRVSTRMGWLHAKMGKARLRLVFSRRRAKDQASLVFAFERLRISSEPARKRREGSHARRHRRPIIVETLR